MQLERTTEVGLELAVGLEQAAAPQRRRPGPVVARRGRPVIEDRQHSLRVAGSPDAQIGLDKVGSPWQRARMVEALALGEGRDPLQLADGALGTAKAQLEKAQHAVAPACGPLDVVLGRERDRLGDVAARFLLEAESRLNARESHQRPADE